ncbi:MAG: hypothetical protein HZA83_00880 [Thaumarchaeota archaeon]|nr:hypothetical protein [Nitrososphaerota archaeon]
MNWKANYQLSMAENTSDILSLASIRNSEDVDYENVSLRLVAGEISKNNNYYNYPVPYAAEAKAGSSAPQVNDIQSTNLFEFKAYDIPALITLNKESSQQIPLLGRNEVDSTKIYTFQSSSYSSKIQTQLVVENTAENKLGVALPGGDVQLYAKFEGKDAYIGETSLPNTAADENMTLDAGVAFDLSGKETRTEHVELDKCTTADTYNIVLKNHKTVPVVITISRYIYEETKITAENYKHTSKSVNEIEWEIPVSANSTSTLTFTTKTTDTYCERYPF